VDRKAPLSEFYSSDVIDVLTAGPTELARWAIPQGQGDLLGALQGEQPIADAVNAVADGTDPAEAAATANEQVASVAESLQ
jgi:multiple sugar transport system substrate-binding protein